VGAGETKESGRWGVAVGVAAVAILLVLMLFRSPKPAPAPAAGQPGLKVVLAPALSDEAALFDTAPLFLPTERNGTVDVPAPQPGGAFADFKPELVLPDDQLRFGLRPPIPVPARPADALTEDPPGNPLLGIGQTDASIAQLPDRSSFVEVVSAATGRRVLAMPLPHAQPPEAFGPDRAPVEYLAFVDPAGLVGTLVPTSGSGSDGIDGYFARYLAQAFRIGDRLTPGIYRVSVGP
jgi:hypothetical protein